MIMLTAKLTTKMFRGVVIGNSEDDLVVEEGGKDGEVGHDPDHDDHRVADHQGKKSRWGQPQKENMISERMMEN